MSKPEFRVERNGDIETQYVGKNIVTFQIDSSGGYHLLGVGRNPKFKEEIPKSLILKIKGWFRRVTKHE